jgi:uroporphyrinogen-III decarboxylase
MSKKYVKIWEKHHGKKLSSNMEIHHIDGNRKNNEVNNLMAVTIEEHLKIHQEQHDYGAVQAILMRMSLTEDQKKLLKECASKHQKKLLKSGKHNFQIPKEERIRRSKKIIEDRLKETGVAFLGIDDPVENGKKARSKLSREKELEMMKAWKEKIQGSKWWVNKEGKRKRSKECPGIDWKEGMDYVQD